MSHSPTLLDETIETVSRIEAAAIEACAPTDNVSIDEESRVTPHAEAFQAMVWHRLACHPKLQKNAPKW